MSKFKVAGYLRISKEEFNSEKDSNSIENQKYIINKYIKEHKELELVDYYIDDGYTGTNFNRPGFNRLIMDINNKKIDIIIVKDLSRLGRNYIEVGNYLEFIFPAIGVGVITINENIDINKDSYYVDDIVTLKNINNDYYAKDISKKVRSVLRTKKLNGEFIGKVAPYGYIKDPEDKHKFIIDETASKIVIKIFDMILEGKSRKQIADYLNDNNIMTPSQYLNIDSSKDKIKKWNTEMITTILKNENYTGTLFQGKKRKLNYRVNKRIKLDKEEWIVTKNHHEAIISKEKFDKVQEIINNHSIRTNRQGSFDNLTGFIKCNDCKGQMILKGGKNKKYYYCTNYFKSKSCTSHSIEKTKLEKMILEELKVESLTRNYLYDNIKCVYVDESKNIIIDYKNHIS